MNAVEAVKELGDIPERTVYVQIDSGEGYYRIDVGNFGDVERFAETVDRIFEEGFSTKGKKGRGYGLHIVKSVVEKHQGFIFPEIIDRMIVFKVRIPKELGDG
ncbi:GHKL domain-containing protein [Bacillus sonorensis]|nr:GHKL domain-containing protein [Bacillus sonorensis]MCY8090238.1 GHKL domain-containing protein [Bacillus sonorensis]